jgi:hypothetical protein
MNNQWSLPQVISDALYAYPATVKHLMPPYEEIPEEFHYISNKWVRIQQRWFFDGLPEKTYFKMKEGIEGDLALRHLSAIQRSFEPKHEHKEAAVAYLMSLWMDDVVFPE